MLAKGDHKKFRAALHTFHRYIDHRRIWAALGPATREECVKLIKTFLDNGGPGKVAFIFSEDRALHGRSMPNVNAAGSVCSSGSASIVVSGDAVCYKGEDDEGGFLLRRAAGR